MLSLSNSIVLYVSIPKKVIYFVLLYSNCRFDVDNRAIISHLFHQWAKKKAFQDPKRLIDKVIKFELLCSDDINGTSQSSIIFS